MDQKRCEIRMVQNQERLSDLIGPYWSTYRIVELRFFNLCCNEAATEALSHTVAVSEGPHHLSSSQPQHPHPKVLQLRRRVVEVGREPQAMGMNSHSNFLELGP